MNRPAVLPLPIALEIIVYIPDLKHGVPNSDLPVWRYRQEIDAAWQPDPATYPGIQVEPLPERRSNLALEAMRDCFKAKVGERQPGDYNPLPTENPVVQAVGRADSVDLRQYHDGTVYGSASSLFLNTVHACFSRHHALGIRPECLMWMVLHEVGVCVQQNADAYRDLFTDSKEKKRIDVRVNVLDIHSFDQPEAWALGVQRLNAGLRKSMPSDLMEHLLPPISTHDLDSETASMVAVLDAASPYYDYLIRTCCGIPAIRLFGEAADYDRIVVACEALAERFSAHLGEYFAHLLPVLREVADTAAGRKEVDNDFWASIYNHYSGSGTDDMDGWITAFVNYTFVGGTYIPKAAALYDWKENLKRNKGQWGSGINRDAIPNHLSCVPFTWNYAKDHGGSNEGEFAGRNFKLDNDGNGVNFDCRLVGGFLAVDDVDGYATPVLSYGVIRGKEMVTTVNADGTWTAQAEGQTPITAVQRSVYADESPDGRVDVCTASEAHDQMAETLE